MPSKRKPSRNAQLQPQPAQSDYDTDTANLTDNQLLSASLPAPPVRSIDELNLIVLRKWYPDIEHIIAIAPYAVLYSLNGAVGEWEKAETEGSLFVCQLSNNPYERYRVVILNRKSIENFTLDLVSLDNIQFESGYIMAQVTDEDIFGIWIFSDGSAEQSTAEAIWDVIENCARRAAHFRDIDYDPAPQNGHGETPTYQFDGTGDDPMEEQQHWNSANAPQPTGSGGGQQIDLAALFKRQQEQGPGHDHHRPQAIWSGPSHAADEAQSAQTIRFNPAADTDFFRTSHSPASASQPQPAPKLEQSVLLDLFKNAKRG